MQQAKLREQSRRLRDLERALAERRPPNGAVGSGTDRGKRASGHRISQEFSYDFGGGLMTNFGAAVLFTGDFYKPAPTAPAPDTLWEAFCRVQLEF